MIKQVFNFAMITGIFLGIIFMFFTSYSKKGKHKVVIYLNLFLLFLTLNNLQITLVDNGYVDVNFFARKLLIPWYAMILSALYTFLTYYLRVEKRVLSVVKISIVLFAIEIVIRIVFVPLYFYENNNYVVAKYAQIEEIVNAVFTIAIYIKAFVLVFKYSKLFQFVLTFDNIKWLKNLMFLGSITLVMWVIAIVLNLDKVINPEIYIYYPMRLSCSIILYWIGYQGFYNYEIMTERIQLRTQILVKNNKPNLIVPKKSIEIHSSFDQIQQFILDSELFLDPNCNVNTIALAMNLNSKILLETIKNTTNHSFSDIINQTRVEIAKKYLKNPDYLYYTIESIGLECGFSSKSAFYNAFKKVTNQTPTDFKKEYS
jgi:AraC-like DNA-binding protein